MECQTFDEEKTIGAVTLRASGSSEQVFENEDDVWDGPNDPARPKNWSQGEKWRATFLLSGFALIQPLAETMLAPVQKPISKDLSITRTYDWVLVNSLILIGVGFGPLILAPISEVYGRKIALLSGGAVFVVWNTACGVSQTLGQMLAFRLLAGFGACVADAVAGGVLADLWLPHERGRAFAVYMAAPLLGPALGPIAGAFIATGTTWRWVFWITSIASAVVFVLAMVFLKETYEPRLAYLRRRRRQSLGGKPTERNAKAGLQELAKETTEFWQLMWTNLQRPLRMLATQLIIQLIAIYMALLYGTMFLFLYMYPLLWTKQYGQSVRIGSLNYISAAIGYVAGVQVAGHLNDSIYSKLKARSSNNIGRPEYRVPVMPIGTLLVPIGLLWWGWSGETRLHWIMPNIGCMLFTAGCYICSCCISVYTIDAYTRYSASAVSTNLVLRSNVAAFFPLFAPYMFQEVGFGWGATILAGSFAVIGFGAIFVLWCFGERIRRRSRYCAANDVEFL
ncbi:MFS general substrate transporter [Lindgomyces ingoldianus]|uniref:MFS general substrate transporter n=1 Tax=Lindgomyces ingoldianus TaxID=673940 RepID=A0ACB6QS90_9PLEO|nr:MFS general substrate transporter [Lindgomyces ingoldianus]KAF2469390.1 MFS general substrate transporter [Lindgomyces ingoldianus]